MTGIWRVEIVRKSGDGVFVGGAMEGIEVAYKVDELVHENIYTGDRIVVYCDLEE